MVKLQPPKKIEVRPTPNMGMGVFATQPIKAGEVLEDCHLIPLPIVKSQDDSIILPDYRFNWPAGVIDWIELVLPLGFGAIYNHSEEYNVIWEDHPSINKVFRYKAVRDIRRGEQCFVYYGNVYFP